MSKEQSFPKYTLEELATHCGGRVVGDPNMTIQGMESLEAAGAEQLSHIESKKYFKRAAGTRAGALIVPEGAAAELNTILGREGNFIETDDVKLAHLKILGMFSTRRRPAGKIMPGALVDDTARVANGATIYPGAYVGEDAEIQAGTVLYPGAVVEAGARVGKDCLLYSNCVVGENCVIGDENILYSGVVIGADGYGYYDKDGTRHKIPQVGIVRTGKRVEIGANTCIDRATMGETYIGDDTKFDNLVQIGHNNKIGEKCYIVSQVGISGSCTVGDHVILAGQVGIADHVNIGNNVFVGAQGGVPNDIGDGERVWNTPCMPIMDAMRVNKIVRNLPELEKRVKKLEGK